MSDKKTLSPAQRRALLATPAGWLACGFGSGLAPVAQGVDGETYNINADTFAGAIAGALSAKRLLFLTDVPRALDKDKKLLSRYIVAVDLRLPDRVTVQLSEAAAAARADALKDKKPAKKGGSA